MFTLFLDLASHSGILALVSDKRVIASEVVDHRITDAELVPLYDALLKKAKVEAKDLDRIACVIGPGGFTSLRVAVAFTNALAFALDIPAAGVHLSEVYGARACHPEEERSDVSRERHAKSNVSMVRDAMRSADRLAPHHDTLWLHSTKKHELFVRGFGAFAQKYPEAALQELGAFVAALQSSEEEFCWMGELIPAHEEMIVAASGVQALLKPLEDVLPGFLRSLSYNKETVLPWYGRGW